MAENPVKVAPGADGRAEPHRDTRVLPVASSARIGAAAGGGLPDAALEALAPQRRTTVALQSSLPNGAWTRSHPDNGRVPCALHQQLRCRIGFFAGDSDDAVRRIAHRNRA